MWTFMFVRFDCLMLWNLFVFIDAVRNHTICLLFLIVIFLNKNVMQFVSVKWNILRCTDIWDSLYRLCELLMPQLRHAGKGKYPKVMGERFPWLQRACFHSSWQLGAVIAVSLITSVISPVNEQLSSYRWVTVVCMTCVFVDFILIFFLF